MEISRITDLLLTESKVFGFNIDSLLREIAGRLPANVFIAHYINLLEDDPNLLDKLTELRNFSIAQDGVLVLSKYDASQLEDRCENPETSHIDVPLVIEFEDTQVARCYFEDFPPLEASFILGFTRSQKGACHYLLLTIPDREALQAFAQRCRRNPWVKAIHEISDEELRKNL